MRLPAALTRAQHPWHVVETLLRVGMRGAGPPGKEDLVNRACTDLLRVSQGGFVPPGSGRTHNGHV